VHTQSATWPMLFGSFWQDHPRIHVKLDNNHPIYAAQHHKIICIDDSLVFVGGIDLTVQRWDRPSHAPDDPLRVGVDGSPYEPVHDIQIAVEGEAARAVTCVAYDRWKTAAGETIDADATVHGLWPPNLKPDFENLPVAVARTAPRWAKIPAVREIEALILDSIKAAKERIYVEAQYLADRRVGDALAAQLSRPDGAEVVLLVTRSAHGTLEAWIMGGNRDRLIRRLRRADRFDRLRVYYPVVGTPHGDREIFIHSKLMIVDDVLLRIGSANLNRRSMGLDAECDVAIEATDYATRAAIAGVRGTLLAEHLGASVRQVAEVFAEEGTLIATIERLNNNPRCLRPYTHISRRGPTGLMPGTRLLDPRGRAPLLALFRKRRRRPQ
jgi:phosphatidylserine/phosphatidylglycerophosphate/cardiolipin synthase-like enzyme